MLQNSVSINKTVTTETVNAVISELSSVIGVNGNEHTLMNALFVIDLHHFHLTGKPAFNEKFTSEINGPHNDAILECIQQFNDSMIIQLNDELSSVVQHIKKEFGFDGQNLVSINTKLTDFIQTSMIYHLTTFKTTFSYDVLGRQNILDRSTNNSKLDGKTLLKEYEETIQYDYLQLKNIEEEIRKNIQ